jgi:hypothetical protein
VREVVKKMNKVKDDEYGWGTSYTYMNKEHCNLQLLCTHVYKWKNNTTETITGAGEEG